MGFTLNEIPMPAGNIQVEKNNALYTRRIMVNFDDPVYDPALVMNLPGMPQRWELYPTDIFAICESVHPSQVQGDPSTWIVEVNYERLSRDQQQAKDNPLDKPPQVSWTAHQFDKPLIYDINGNAVTNSAGDRFNPPYTYDDSRLVATIGWNNAFVPTWVVNVRNKINTFPFTIEGVFVDQKCARVQTLDISHWQVENNVYFRRVTLSLEIRDPYTIKNVSPSSFKASGGSPSLSNVLTNQTVYGWQVALLDCGYQQWNYASGRLDRIVNTVGRDTPDAYLLDGIGRKLTEGSAVGTECYRVYDVYQDIDFSYFNIPP